MTTTAQHANSIPPAGHPHAQAKYQVRFDWGVDGAAIIGGGADVIVAVDVLDSSGGDSAGGDSALAGWVADGGQLLLAGGFTDAALVADRVLEEQVRLGRRVYVAVVAVGAPRDGGIRFCVEDLLGAGAVIDALAAVGLDYASPEAAAACAAFTGLRGAVTHLATASASAQELAASGATPVEIRSRAVLGSAESVTVLRAG